MPKLENEILSQFFVAGLFSVIGFIRLFMAVGTRHTSELSFRKHHITQRVRYRVVLITLLFDIPAMHVLWRYGYRDTWHVFCLAMGSTFATPYGLCMAVGVCYPLIAVIALLLIRWFPSEYAYRKGKLYALTRLVRAGDRTLVPWR